MAFTHLNIVEAIHSIVEVEWLRMMSVEKALVISGLIVLFVQNHFVLTITKGNCIGGTHPKSIRMVRWKYKGADRS